MSASRPKTDHPDRFLQVAQALAVLVPLLVYLRTLARSVTFIDGGELAAAAAVLGIAHPPGYPLFTLLGHLLSLFPFGPVFFRVALLSALASAAAAGLVFRIGWWLGSASTRERQRPGDWSGRLAAAGALAGAWLFAFADTPWSQAVIVEVYALHGCLVAACLGACLLVSGATVAPTPPAPRWRDAWWLPGFLLALALTNHLTSVLLAPSVAITLGLALFGSNGVRRSGKRPALRIVAAALLPLPLYLYLPIRSRMHPPVDWDYPETWHRFYIHVSAAQYRPILGSEGVKFGELRRFFLSQLPHEANWILPILALAGLVVLGRERRRALLVLLPTLAAFLLYNMAYPIHDIAVYYLPVVLLLAVCAGTGAAWIGRRVAGALPERPIGFVARVAAGLALTALALPALVTNFARNDQRNRRLPEFFARDAVRYADPKGVIFSADADLFSEPMIYLQTVEKLRPDLVVLDIDRLESPMLARNLQEWYPELGEACRREIAVIADFAAQAERGQPFDGRRREAAYTEMLRALVRESVRLRPTYALGGAYRNVMFKGYERHPEGLLVRLTTDATYRPFPAPRFELPAAVQGRKTGYEERLLLSEYGRMLDGRDWYLGQHGRAAEADTIRALMGRLPH